ncbi:MAG: ABC transporter substrate-binding protein [Chloroflexi bacterium]|nr:ABC transporter substrate-binding protein [Chloroflexota bacterium]
MNTKLIQKALGLLALASIVLTACGGGAAVPASNVQQSIGKGEGEVDIIAWAGYIERGATDKNYDWVTQFEKETGCAVKDKVASTSDEMVTLMNQGGFDLVTASGDASLRLVYGGTVQEVNIALIKDWNRIDQRLQNGGWHTVNGKHYGVPYQWGPNVLMYNTQAFGDTAPASWNVVFEEMTLADGKSNKGRVQAYVGPIYIADAAVYLKAHKPELGITDPYELTKPQFDAAVALLKQQRQLVQRYWPDATSQIDDFTNEGVVAGTSWPYQVNTLVAAGQPIASLVPSEGTTGWADTTMMHAKAPHPNCAYMWLGWSLNKKLQGDLASWFGSVPVTPDACQGNDLLGAEGCKTNGIDNFDKIAFWKTPIADCGNGKQDCVPYSEWTKAYVDITGSK